MTTNGAFHWYFCLSRSRHLDRLSCEHEDIYEAIARQDSDATRAAMRLHLTGAAGIYRNPIRART
ncbi:FCD domain-containing protein [Pseudomonas thivervalensis]|uniref:FCD domain-containing protein n=1 Tax=Pseudomonas thivervalensis TaxID=86265 RepID=UPI00264640A6|nr:FCD domain-containing protein [Pseudomonas thivervalensis]